MLCRRHISGLCRGEGNTAAVWRGLSWLCFREQHRPQQHSGRSRSTRQPPIGQLADGGCVAAARRLSCRCATPQVQCGCQHLDYLGSVCYVMTFQAPFRVQGAAPRPAGCRSARGTARAGRARRPQPGPETPRARRRSRPPGGALRMSCGPPPAHGQQRRWSELKKCLHTSTACASRRDAMSNPCSGGTRLSSKHVLLAVPPAPPADTRRLGLPDVIASGGCIKLTCQPALARQPERAPAAA